MASVPLRSTKVVAAPKDYDVPLAQEILLLSVKAEFIDNGAAGDWLPAVVILDNDGNALAHAVDQSVKVTAGDDASVTFFPGVKHGGATVATHICTIVTNLTATSGSDALFNNMTINSFATDDSANFVQQSATQFTTPLKDLWCFVRCSNNTAPFVVLTGDVIIGLRCGGGGHFIQTTGANGENVGVLTTGGGIDSGFTPGNFSLQIAGTDGNLWGATCEIMGTY